MRQHACMELLRYVYDIDCLYMYKYKQNLNISERWSTSCAKLTSVSVRTEINKYSSTCWATQRAQFDLLTGYPCGCNATLATLPVLKCFCTYMNGEHEPCTAGTKYIYESPHTFALCSCVWYCGVEMLVHAPSSPFKISLLF